MRAPIKQLLAAMALGTMALGAVERVSAGPVPSSTAAVKAAAPGEAIVVGYFYRDYAGAWVNGPLAVGVLSAAVVAPFYLPAYYPAYVYAAPPVYYTPLSYYGPPVVYGRPVLAPDPYFPMFYPYIRSAGPYWRYGRYGYRGYRGRWGY
jgi:hypothetical protein